MTEPGDAEMTEQQVMALSGQRTPEAARLYVKRIEAQRIVAARRRRASAEEERKDDKIQNARVNLQVTDFIGGCRRTRTFDPLIKSRQQLQ
jgi:hypothetical protein